MTDTIIAGLLAILGVVIGILSTHLIHYIDRKFEERKLVNESIHYLLEVYFQLNRMDMGKMKDECWNYYLQSIRKFIPDEIDDNVIRELGKEKFLSLLNKSLTIITQQSFEELNNLGERYEDMVAKLATILPVNAYYMRGKNNLGNLIQILSKYFNSIRESDNEKESSVNEFINQTQLAVTKIILDDYKNDLKSELCELLKKTTRFNRRKGKEIIKKIESVELTDNDKREIDTLIGGVVDGIMSNLNQTERQKL